MFNKFVVRPFLVAFVNVLFIGVDAVGQNEFAIQISFDYHALATANIQCWSEV